MALNHGSLSLLGRGRARGLSRNSHAYPCAGCIMPPYSARVHNRLFVMRLLLIHNFLLVRRPSGDLLLSHIGLRFSHLACGSSRSTPVFPSNGDCG